MRQSKFKLAAGAALAAIVVAGMVIAIVSFIESKRRTRLLPGGVELSLLAVTSATNTYFPGGPLDKFMHSVFPGRSFRVGPFKYLPVAPFDETRRNTNGNLRMPDQQIFWLRAKGSRSLTLFPNSDYLGPAGARRATISDEQGEEWDTLAWPTHFFPPAGIGHRRD
jgi:hypothetical protein